MAYKCWGIKPKNIQQEEALKALLDPSIELVVLNGLAGSGKTILALAAALEQVIENKTYTDIIFTRSLVPVGEEIGFLPGSEQEKMSPWCGALADNLEVLAGTHKLTMSLIEPRIRVCATQFMRGRSFINKYIILDEVQNFTSQQLKVLLTRAGEDCKVVCLGDPDQIDNKKLSSEYNALQYLCDRGKDDQEFIKVIHLPEGVRSRLSAWAAKIL
jgi:PhoH-like ATPase